MQVVQNKSDRAPVGRLVIEALRRAEAMGVVEPHTEPHTDPHRDARGAARPGAAASDVEAVRRLARRLGRAGIATATAAHLDNVEAPSAGELASMLELLIAALEASPSPKFEWGGLGRVFDPEDLAALLHVSVSSLKRYQSGERETPDAIAARLHFLALLVGDLAGSYSEVGVRRWFQRKRTQLDGRAPAAFLKGAWDPDDEGPLRVRALARDLVTFSAA
jgi:hypothetical protein